MKKIADVFTWYIPSLGVMALGALCLFILALGCFIPPQKKSWSFLKEVWDDLDLRGAWREMMS